VSVFVCSTAVPNTVLHNVVVLSTTAVCLLNKLFEGVCYLELSTSLAAVTCVERAVALVLGVFVQSRVFGTGVRAERMCFANYPTQRAHIAHGYEVVGFGTIVMVLQEHYDSARANNLVALGDMSSLGRVIGEAHPFSQFEIDKENPDFDKLIALHEHAKAQGYCTFYARDRGETGTEFKVAHTFEEFVEQADGCGAEYYYIMKDGVWYVGDTYNASPLSKRLTLLTEALAKETA